MDSGQSEIAVEARGLRCPWPALRLARAARDAAPGTTLVLTADDPAAAAEIAALAAARGWPLDAAPPCFRVRLPG